MRRLTRGQRVLLDVAMSLGGTIHVFADQRSDVAKLVSCGYMTTTGKIIDQQATITPSGLAALAQSEERK
jgi:hypothetical protein